MPPGAGSRGIGATVGSVISRGESDLVEEAAQQLMNMQGGSGSLPAAIWRPADPPPPALEPSRAPGLQAKVVGVRQTEKSQPPELPPRRRAELRRLVDGAAPDLRQAPAAQLPLATIYEALGEKRMAYLHFGRAADLDPSSARAWLGRGFAADGLGLREAARESARRAIELEPHNERARTLLKLSQGIEPVDLPPASKPEPPTEAWVEASAGPAWGGGAADARGAAVHAGRTAAPRAAARERLAAVEGGAFARIGASSAEEASFARALGLARSHNSAGAFEAALKAAAWAARLAADDYARAEVHQAKAYALAGLGRRARMIEELRLAAQLDSRAEPLLKRALSAQQGASGLALFEEESPGAARVASRRPLPAWPAVWALSWALFLSWAAFAVLWLRRARREAPDAGPLSRAAD